MAFRAQFLNIIKTLIDNEISPSGSNLDRAHLQKGRITKGRMTKGRTIKRENDQKVE